MTPEQIAKLPYRKNVGIVLLNDQNQVFVGQRLDSEVPAWQMPQGGIDKGEDAQTAALRELKEETGVATSSVTFLAQSKGWITYDLPHDIVPRIWKGRFKGQEQKWFLFRFHGSDEEINIEVDHQEFSEWRWLPFDQLVANIVPFKRAVYEQVVAEFAPYL
ncbi:RNA pyrophosphohydrolase [Cognatishimia sp. WU-CL00825]|uniref:RNA pyrophosphohydrolase n=1 Tax=Cognatishimia sp. WU-CL00825 TaxID=3127658 RepID=UPI00310C4933